MNHAHEFLDQVFHSARTPTAFTSRPVLPDLLRRIYDTAKMGPTSMNSQPARYVFLTTPEAKMRLLPALSAGNVDRAGQAPVIVIAATDMRFHEFMPKVFPHRPNARDMFEKDQVLTSSTALRNATLGSAYFMLAARAMGLDCGPMSGFDAEKVNADFFADGRWQVNYLICLGHGDPLKQFDRNPRLTFEEAALVL